MHKNKSQAETPNLYGSILQMSRNRFNTSQGLFKLYFYTSVLHILQFCVVCPNKTDSQLVFLDDGREQVNSCVCPKSFKHHL